jgi:hypothetical protein
MGMFKASGEVVKAESYVAQIGLEPCLPLPQMDLAYGLSAGDAKGWETVQDRGADLDFRDMTIEVTSREGASRRGFNGCARSIVLSHDLQFCLVHKARHLSADCSFICLIAQVTGYFTENTFMSSFFKIGFCYFLRVNASVISRLAQHLSCPETQEFIALCVSFELHLSIMRKLVFKGFLSVVEGVHLGFLRLIVFVAKRWRTSVLGTNLGFFQREKTGKVEANEPSRRHSCKVDYG